MDGAVPCPSCQTENAAGSKFCSECGTALARSCTSCGALVAPTAKFCAECGSALAGTAAPAAPAPAPTPVAERRLVTVLFADLVGFTSQSESRDAEETRELLSLYFETARNVIERYGGRVEKFIGDAVMALWGAPVAQEDDAERGVRAALELVSAVEGLGADVRVRAGVLTGEAAVTIGAEGEGMVAGDLVNTASRVQSAAEPGTVLVGDSTRRASDAAIAYEDGGIHEVKGKTEPLQLWRALRVIANRGGEGRSAGLEPPFVGRDRELRLVKELFHASAEEEKAHLLSVVGVAGIGKSRLAWEFEKYIDGLVASVWWHKGRCLAYGDAIAYWALAEMVRMRARIGEDEPADSAQAKLTAGDRAVRLRSGGARLRRAAAPAAARPDRPCARPTARISSPGWRMFFERMAEQRARRADLRGHPVGRLGPRRVRRVPARMVAEPADLRDHARPARDLRPPPELGARARGASARSSSSRLPGRRSTRSCRARARPADAASRADPRPRRRHSALRGRDRAHAPRPRAARTRTATSTGRSARSTTLDVPETLQALIAARLDGLDPEERRLLGDASVLGKTFSVAVWPLSRARARRRRRRCSRGLVRKEVLALESDPRSPERGQYGFLQALVQRVAYETLSRHDRKAKHLRAADYLAEEAGIDPDEIAEVIAAHYLDAYRADEGADDAEAIQAAGREWLIRAGERAAALAAPQDARRAFDQASELAAGPLERASLVERAGNLAIDAYEDAVAVDRLAEAQDLFESAGKTHDAARAAAQRSRALWNLGRIEEAIDLLEPAYAVLSADEPDADVAMLAAESARVHHFAGHAEIAVERVEFALRIAEEQVLPEVLSHALNTKALLRMGGPHESHALLREALDIALAHDLVQAALRAYNNLMVVCYTMDRREELDRSWSTRSSSPYAAEVARTPSGSDPAGSSRCSRRETGRARSSSPSSGYRSNRPTSRPTPACCSGWRGRTSSETIPRSCGECWPSPHRTWTPTPPTCRCWATSSGGGS